MSVRKNDRVECEDTNYYYNALELRRNITFLLLRDFGVKPRIKTIDFYAKINHIQEEDKVILDQFINKYHLDNKVLEEYPNWIIDYLRNNMLKTLHNLIYAITQADNLQTVINKRQFFDKQSYQNKALGELEVLLQEMRFALDILGTDANKLMPYIDQILKEREALKKWKKKCNKIYTSLTE